MKALGFGLVTDDCPAVGLGILPGRLVLLDDRSFGMEHGRGSMFGIPGVVTEVRYSKGKLSPEIVDLELKKLSKRSITILSKSAAGSCTSLICSI